MGFSEFCNISRHVIRNLNLFKSQQISTIKRINQIKQSLTATAPTSTQSINEIRISNIQNQHPCSILQKQKSSSNDQHNKNNSSSSNNDGNPCEIAIFALVSFNLFGFGKADGEVEETPEAKLITTIKRSIWCIQREQYDKAEQMLHLALRMAQDIQSSEGITYCYDLMANLAMEREQFKKAEKIFADVIKRLLEAGHAEDSSAILHISAKLAHMAHLQGEVEKSALGFEWTMQKVAAKCKELPEDRDLQELFGLTKNWYGRLLMQMGKYQQAKRVFMEALDTLIEIYGEENEDAITIMNNLGVTCVSLEEFEQAKEFLKRALKLAKDMKDSAQENILEANIGLVYLREGLTKEALDHCNVAYRMAKKQKHTEGIEQAAYCLDEIRLYLEQN